MDPDLSARIAAAFSAAMPHPPQDIMVQFDGRMIVWGFSDRTVMWEIEVPSNGLVYRMAYAAGPSAGSRAYSWEVGAIDKVQADQAEAMLNEGGA